MDASSVMSRRPRAILSLAVFRRRGLARRASALLGILGLLQLCLVPVLHSAAAASGPAWLKGAICRAVPVVDDGAPAAPQKPRLCPICLALSLSDGLALPAVAALAVPRTPAIPIRSTPVMPRRARWLDFAALPRAPPVMA